MNTEMFMLKLSTFKRISDTTPVCGNLPLSKWQQRLTRHSVREDKDGPLYSPAIWKPGSTRGNEGIVELTACVLDCEKTAPPFAQVQPRLEGKSAIWHTTHRHTSENERYRIILPLSQPVSPEVWPSVHRGAVRSLNLDGRIDPTCAESARAYYAASCPPEIEADSFSGFTAGDLWNPDELKALVADEPIPAEFSEDAVASKKSIGGRPGDDFNQRTTWGEILSPHGWRQVSESRGIAKWVKPGDPGHEHQATTNNAGSDLFYCFSPDAPPMPCAKALSKFAVHALLNHDGDYSAAAKDLAGKGYGEPIPTPCRTEQSPSEIEFESLHWPALDQAAIPNGIVADFLDLACSNSEADPAAVLATFLVRFGIECGTGPHVMVGESRHTARSNCVIVGDSSKSRKGTSAGPVKSIFAGIDGCRTSPGPLSSGEGIIYNVRDEVREWRVDKKGDAGEWVISDPGVDDKRLFVMDEEFANALSATKREGNTLSSIVRCLYDDGNAEPLTKSNRIKTTGAHVGITTHITLFELKKRLTENEQFNGFGNRFLWICAKRNGIVPFPEPMDDYKKRKLQVILKERLNRALVAGKVTFSDEAKSLWMAEYPRLSMAHTGLAGCMVNRAEAHVTRLALTYSLLAGHDRIEFQDLQAAMAFWGYCHESAFYIFGGAPADRRKLKIIEYLKSRDGQSATKNEIRREVFNNHMPATELSELLTLMETDSLIDCITEPTGGAPRTMIILKHSCVKSVKSPPTEDVTDLITLKTLITQTNFETGTVNNSGEPPLFDFDKKPIATGGAS